MMITVPKQTLSIYYRVMAADYPPDIIHTEYVKHVHDNDASYRVHEIVMARLGKSSIIVYHALLLKYDIRQLMSSSCITYA